MEVTGALDDLDTMFSPRTVAVVGASETPGSVGGVTLRNMLRGPFGGTVYAVNPRSATVFDQPTHPTVGDLPETPDLAIISVSAEQVLDVLRACAAREIRNAIILSSGFSEIGGDGANLQDEVRALATATGIRLCGPNCAGFLNTDIGLLANFASYDALPSPTGIALATQSGGVAGFTLRAANQRGVPLGWYISTGNEIDVTAADAARYLLRQPSTRVLLCFMESFGRAEQFFDTAREARERDIPLILLKAGRSDAGARATLTHTASLSGAADVLDEVCRQHGVIPVRSLEEMLDLALVFRSGRRTRGTNVGIVTPSGGIGAVATDHAADCGLTVPEFGAADSGSLRRLFGDPFFGNVSNPIDTTAAISKTPELFGDLLVALAAIDAVDIVVPVVFAQHQANVDGVLRLLETTDKPVVVAATALPPEFVDSAVPSYPDTDRAMRAASALAEYSTRQQRNTAVLVPDQVRRDRVIDHLRQSGPAVTEAVASEILREYRIPFAASTVVRSPDEAERAFPTVGGSVVMKVLSVDVQHKADAGGVRLGIESAALARAAFTDIVDAVSRTVPDARIDGVLVQRAVGARLELLTGIHRDESVGHVVIVGFGGQLVELIHSRVMLRPPFDRVDAQSALARLADGRLLSGRQALTDAERDQVIDVMLALGQLALDVPELTSFELNPLRVGDGLAVAVDALGQFEEIG